MTPEIIISAYRAADLPAIAQLFRETIHTVNRRDYSPEQVEAWAPPQTDLARWQQKLASEEVVVAECAGELVGFCAWTPEGYLDFIFVHHGHQRKGIAQKLYHACERRLRELGCARLHTQASVTAQPFFLRQGYTVVQHQTVKVRGVDLPNAVMEKRLS